MLAQKEIRLLTKQEVKIADIGDVHVVLIRFFTCCFNLTDSTEYFMQARKGTRSTPIFVFTCITKPVLGACIVLKHFELLSTVLARHKLFGQHTCTCMTSL